MEQAAAQAEGKQVVIVGDSGESVKAERAEKVKTQWQLLV
jgi:hypothetical protein